MKTAPFLLTMFVTAWGISTAAALDFTPRQETQIIDAYPIHYLSFADGEQRIGYGPPIGWKYNGAGNKLSLEDPKNGQAQASFTALPIAKVAPFGPANLVNFKAFAKTLVPTDGQLLNFAESTGRNLLGNRESYTADLTYAYYGQKYCARVTFINLEKTVLQIVSTAPAKEFTAFNNALESSYCSWHPMPK